MPCRREEGKEGLKTGAARSIVVPFHRQVFFTRLLSNWIVVRTSFSSPDQTERLKVTLSSRKTHNQWLESLSLPNTERRG